ncbi:threonine dehydrogenase-like Zn-dependent dehydrogenase [Actinopolyspora biskrensis]|uniref:Threonine dehydrogenase-like Zn-dependent dehydrogenase n=1 Tax=Actinopolyspora biskrensis TaxID=1470178 RepID=A0A852Z9T4_9ACTN|nr:glucose 1-dehydrogenase [Actinopolyspora biskrensis]NYH78853.1 threonine dehydrogenase-like Zn-dependent dehydrogenase [Actinopolyspora biskrensis]
MKAATVIPGKPDSSAVNELPDPEPEPGELLVEGLLAGVCGTDEDVVSSVHGSAPPGKDRLVLFHESLGRVRYAPAISGFREGDHLVGVVRRPDPQPCAACAAGQWDFCRNNGYTECGIKELDGFGAQLWTVEPRFAVPVAHRLGDLGVLTEPASVVAKAWEQAEKIGKRSYFSPRRVLVTGAGPVGLLAALMGAQRELEVHVLDRVTEGTKPDLVRALGASYHTSLDELGFEPEMVFEATGSGEVVFDVLRRTSRNAITVLLGISGSDRTVRVPTGAVNDELVLDNDVVLGSVSANLRHYRSAVQALDNADREWLGRLISRRVPLDRWQEALSSEQDDVKVVVDLRD